MKILEVRDSFIKLESGEKLELGAFLEVKDVENKYIAQVIKIYKNIEKYVSVAKLLFLYDGTFNPLKGKEPHLDAKIVEFPFDIIQEAFNVNDSIKLGNYLNSTQGVYINKNSLNRSFLASIDTPAKISDFVTSVAKNFDKSKVLVIDMLGVMNSSVKYKASQDFKLPLNYDSLEFIYDDCLTDATSDSKGLIKEIFSDLAEYTKTVPFVPFGTLKAIVDDMVEKSHIFKLLVLKNKLAKFEKEGYFAITKDEVDSLNRIINLKSSVLDLSVLNSQFQNRYLKLIYAELLKEKYDGQVFVIASNAIDKKNIKSILQDSLISSTFITHSRFKYLNDFKSLFTNYLLEQSFSNSEIFKSYSMYLNNMSKDKLLLVGDATNFLPIIIKIEDVEESPFDDVIEIESDEISEVIQSDAEELNAILYEVEAPLDPHIVAIEKKSEVLIEKISADIEKPMQEALFIDLNNDDDVEEESCILDEISNQDASVAIPTQTFKNETEFHTEVDNFSIENLEEDEQQQEIIKNNVEVSGELIEQIEKDEVIELDADVILEEKPINIQEENLIIPSEEQELEKQGDNSLYEEIEYPTELSEIAEYDSIEEENSESVNFEEQVDETISDYIETEIVAPEQNLDETDSILDLDEIADSDEVIAIDITDPVEEALNREIIEDVDKVFTTIKDDSLSESDLDFIDELNDESDRKIDESLDVENIESSLEEIDGEDDSVLVSEFEELNEYQEELEESFIEPIEELESVLDNDLDKPKEVLETKPSSTPSVPVYEAEIPQEDLVMSDPIEQGDTVNHAKYGVGIVEKMIKYGSKTLYSINFDNVGRRLLDPTLTEIKKA